MILSRIPQILPAVAACVVGVAATGFTVNDARACDPLPAPEGVSSMPRFGEQGYPGNGVFVEFGATQTPEWTLDGEAIAMESVDLGASVASTVLAQMYRPVTAIPAGSTIDAVECIFSDCTLMIGPEDTSAPETPALTNAEIFLDRDRSRGPCGGAFSTLTFDLSADDGAGDAVTDLIVIAYLGADASSAESEATAARVFRVPDNSDQDGRIIIKLSESDNAQFPTSRAFCMAVEVMDRAGNVSPRSDALCLDPTDGEAPNVTGPGADGCAVSAPGSSSSPPSSPWALALFGFVLLGARRVTRKDV